MESLLYTCSRCESRLPASAFSWSNRDSRSGKKYRYSQCKACVVKKVAEWRAANPEKSRTLNRDSTARRRSDPVRHAHEREMENARRRSRTKRGQTFETDCKRCGEHFSYVFVQKHRTVCDLCRKHDADWKTFGLTGPEAAALRSRKACDICGRTENPGGRFNNWHIDHCHDTKKVRGLLCANCNTVLGLMGSDPARLRAAAEYLET